MSTDTYVIRVTCDEDGIDVTLRLTRTQFLAIEALAKGCESDDRYYCGPSIIVMSKNGVSAE